MNTVDTFCPHHMSSMGSTIMTKALVGRFLVVAFLQLPEVQMIVERYQDDMPTGMQQLRESFGPICCYVSPEIRKFCLHEAVMMVAYGPRIPAPDQSYFTQQDFLTDYRSL